MAKKSDKPEWDPKDPDYLVKAREYYLEKEKGGVQAAMNAAAEDEDSAFPSPLRPDMQNPEAPEGVVGGKIAKGADKEGMTFPDAPDRGEERHGAAKGKK